MAREQGGLGPCRPWAGPGAEAGALLNLEGEKVCGMGAGGKVQSLAFQGRGKEKHLGLPLYQSVSQGSSTGQQMRACGLGDPGRGLLTSKRDSSLLRTHHHTFCGTCGSSSWSQIWPRFLV